MIEKGEYFKFELPPQASHSFEKKESRRDLNVADFLAY
jgi:hypothetical protein